MPKGHVGKFLLYVRYVLGNMAAGFLVAVPAQLILRGKDLYLVHSLAYGIVFLLGFALLIPISRFDWRTTTVPEFMRFESITNLFASIFSGILLGMSFILPELHRNMHVFLIVFFINFMAFLHKKTHSFLFNARFLTREPAFDPSGPTVADGDTVFRPRP
ncbi:MAG: hypothetical protein ACYTFG_01320 [Planctomycetota bacterium]|jgi:hypothetical protein